VHDDLEELIEHAGEIEEEDLHQLRMRTYVSRPPEQDPQSSPDDQPAPDAHEKPQAAEAGQAGDAGEEHAELPGVSKKPRPKRP
jgi:hypothetical protein